MSLQIFCPILNQFFFSFFFLYYLLWCMSSLYILDISPLSDTWFTPILSHSVAWLFILLMVSSTVQKILAWCHLWISWIWVFVFFPKLGKFSAIIFSNKIGALFCLSSPAGTLVIRILVCLLLFFPEAIFSFFSFDALIG